MKKIWNNLLGRFRREQFKNLPWGVLSVLVGLAVVTFIWSILQTGDWAGAAMNFSTEMAGAVVTYLLIEIVLGTRQRKEQLIAQMGSTIRDISIPAVEELRRNGWLKDGSLRGAVFFEANLVEAELFGANLEGASLSQCNLKGAFITEANLKGTNFTIANLEGAYLGMSNLQGADLAGANLRGAHLSESFLEGANLHHADLNEAQFINTNLTKAKLTGANFTKANYLVDANLQGAVYNRLTIWPDGFDPVEAGAIFVDKDEPNLKYPESGG